MAWIHESPGRGDRRWMHAVALAVAAAGIAGLVWGRGAQQQIVFPVLGLVLAGFFGSLARGEKGHFLSVDEQRVSWRWHPGSRKAEADVAVADLRELHRESEPPVVRDGRTERRRVQQVFVVTADGGRRRLPPHVLRDWTTLVAKLREVRPDLKVVERETGDFSPAEG